MKTTEKDFLEPYATVFGKYVQFKRSLGESICQGVICRLCKLSKFLVERHGSEFSFSSSDVEGFLSRFKNNSTREGCESLLRQLDLFLRSNGYVEAYVLPPFIRRKEGNGFVPYIFSDEEVNLIFHAADNFNWYRQCAEKQFFYGTLLRLLYSTGLRINEALSLSVADVDMENRILHIRNAKGNTSRLVPYCESLQTWISLYAKKNRSDGDVFFFRSPRSDRYAVVTVQNAFARILAEAGICPCSGKRISLHSFRHTFACKALDGMVKAGKDPYCALPYLSAYLGHANVESTEHYLRLTEDRFSSVTDAGNSIYGGILSHEE